MIPRLYSQDATAPEETTPKDNKILKLTLKEAVEQVLDNNLTIQNSKYEMILADSALYKNESKFAWKALAGIEVSKVKLPSNNNNVFSGTKQTQDKISIGIEKLFKTGTYFKAEASTMRFDTNAFESNLTPAAFQALAMPPLYTGSVGITLSQELLKYSFGKTEENRIKMMRKQAVIRREELIFQLTNLVAKTLVDYWSLAVADSAVLTYEKLLKNTKQIRNLTYRKQRIGLAERFEANQWNALIFQIDGQLQKQKNDREKARRDLVRILNVNPSSQISGVTDLTEALPEKPNFEDEFTYAYSNRIDLLNILRRKEVARLVLSNAKDEDMPSLTISGSYASTGQNVFSPQSNYLNTQLGIPSTKFPTMSAKIQLTYPLWDKGIKAGIRDAELELKKLDEEESKLKKEIQDELRIRWLAIENSHQILLDSKKTEQESEKYYKGIYRRFSQGSYQAVAVKNALDSLLQSQLQTIQAKINFNINLLRYDLAKNFLFTRFGIDIKEIIDKATKQAKKS
ncbi:MAG: TolC family protein [Spirochaetota bacterium]